MPSSHLDLSVLGLAVDHCPDSLSAQREIFVLWESSWLKIFATQATISSISSVNSLTLHITARHTKVYEFPGENGPERDVGLT